MAHLAAMLPRQLKPWIWRKLSDHMHLNYRLPSGIRVKIASYSDWCIYNDIFIAGEYDHAIETALKKASDKKTLQVVDLGANVGFFTLRVLDLITRLKNPFLKVDCLLVEASPKLEQAIRDHLETVRKLGIHAQVVIGLVGKKNGEAHLEIKRSECMNEVVGEQSRTSRKMAYYDLDQMLATVPAIDLLKCDIEGSERDFLKSYPHLLQKTNVAIFEFHEPQCPAVSGSAEVMLAGFTERQVLYDQGRAQTIFFQR